MFVLICLSHPIPLIGVAEFPCQNGTIFCKEKQQIVRRHMGTTDRIKNANKVKKQSLICQLLSCLMIKVNQYMCILGISYVCVYE